MRRATTSHIGDVFRGICICVLLCSLGIAVAANPETTDEGPLPRLRHDPFAERVAGRSSSGGAGPFAPILQGTLISEDDALANLGGRILRIGEATHGYRLIAVREGEAEFETEGGGRLVLELVQPDDEDEE